MQRAGLHDYYSSDNLALRFNPAGTRRHYIVLRRWDVITLYWRPFDVTMSSCSIDVTSTSLWRHIPAGKVRRTEMYRRTCTFHNNLFVVGSLIEIPLPPCIKCFWKVLIILSGHTKSKWRCIDVSAPWWRRIDSNMTTYWRDVPAEFKVLDNEIGHPNQSKVKRQRTKKINAFHTLITGNFPRWHRRYQPLPNHYQRFEMELTCYYYFHRADRALRLF